jgi:hypothetical protein
MKFTAIFAALALAAGAAAQADRQDNMRNLARSLIAEYEDFLEERANRVDPTFRCEARSPQGTSGMKCDPYSCNQYCVLKNVKCGWSTSNLPSNCVKCKCQKG